MEKISRIIPSSPRTRATIEVAGQPARPGAPSLGRPMGRTTPRNFFDENATESSVSKRADDMVSTQLPSTAGVEDRVQFSSLAQDGAKSAGDSESTVYTAKAAKPKAQLVEELAKRFFEGTPKTVIKDQSDAVPPMETPAATEL